MVPEEDEVSLVVEGDHPSSSELGVLREERGEQPAHSHAYLRVEVVEDQLRDVLCRNCVVLDLLLVLHTGDFEDGQHAFQVPDEQLPAVRVTQYHHMRIVERLGVLVNLFQLHVSPGVKGDVVKDHHDFFEEVVDLDWRLELRSDEYLDWCVIVEYVVELIEHGLVILLHKLFPAFLFVLDSDRLLPQFLRQLLPLLALLHLDLVLDHVSLPVHLHSLLLVLDLVGLLLEGSGELQHALRLGTHRLDLLLGRPHLLLMRF